MKFKRYLALAVCIVSMLACAGCDAKNTENVENTPQNEIDTMLDSMTLEEKTAQLFIVQPEAIVDTGIVVQAGDVTKQAIDATPVGGFIYFSDNLQSPEQTQEMLKNVQDYSMERTGLPAFLSVDEEGGTVARIANNENFDVPQVGNMADIGASGDIDAARDVGDTIGGYLAELGFNLDFAPVADVLSNP
ncbi:MAG: glycoside hydrolase family 3 N-terminal domain-containing protein, partial [Eubacteriales bacterium]|nr:glycoside hydrolase family 3 N-terminal domain-containing protein [Eubacteriales bacterium]